MTQQAQRDFGVTFKSAMAKMSPPRTGSKSRQSTISPLPETDGQGRTTDRVSGQALTGLGIIGPVNNERQPSAAQAPKEVSTSASKLMPPRPPVIRAPASDPIPYAEAGSGGILQKPLTPSPLRVSRSFSMFPSLADPRERRPRTNELIPSIAKARSHIDLRVDNKPPDLQMLAGSSETPQAGLSVPVGRTQPAKEEAGFFGMANKPVELPANEAVQPEHAEVDKPRSRPPSALPPAESVPDASELSPLAPATSDSMATVSSLSPQTPDDFLHAGGLRSHPVTPTPADMHSRQSSVTALPVFPTNTSTNVSTTRLPTFAPAMDIDDDFFIVETKKRTLIPKKPSLAAMRTLFPRKNPARDMRLGAGGLGGCVDVT